MSKKNVSDDEFYVIGQSERFTEARKKKLIKILVNALAVLLCAAVFTLILQYTVLRPKHSLKPLGSQDLSICHPYTERIDTIINGLKLTLYIPHNAAAKLTIGCPDSSLIENSVLAFRASDLGSNIENPQPEDFKIVGAFVYEGNLLQSENEVAKPKPGFCAIIDGKVTVGISESTPYFEEAVNKSGYFFRHFPVVDNGKAEDCHPNKNSTTRRALCDRNGEIFVAVAETNPMNFANALSELGVVNAISLLGYYKSFGGWWRDVDGNIEFFRKNDEYVVYEYENYIVWE